MNVKLTYTVGIEEVRLQASNLMIFDHLSEHLEVDCSTLIQDIQNEDESLESVLTAIHEYRLRLKKLDTRLEDVANILAGLQELSYNTGMKLSPSDE